MAQKMKITNTLAHLPNEITITGWKQLAHSTELFLCWKPAPCPCPDCGSMDIVCKGRSASKTVPHLPMGNSRLLLTFTLQRFRCKDCGRSFVEEPYWLHPTLSISISLYLSICRSLTTTASIRDIARSHQVPDHTVSAVLKSVHFGRPSHLPDVLCIDEFHGSTGVWDSEHSRWIADQFHCNLSDGRFGHVIDVLPRIDLAFLKEYFAGFTAEERSCVRYFCTDMHGGFLSLAKQCFPQTLICVDMFHVVQLLNENVTGVRRQLQRELKEQSARALSFGNRERYRELEHQYLLLKNCARLLTTAAYHSKERWAAHYTANLKRLQECLALSAELKESFEALQVFHSILSCSSYTERCAVLTDWLEVYTHSEWEGTRRAANTLRRNRAYIRNSWKSGHSNAVCEGLNNRIKVLKRNAYGQHSFENFRNRILFACSNLRHVEEAYTTAAEKRIGSRGTNTTKHPTRKEVK